MLGLGISLIRIGAKAAVAIVDAVAGRYYRQPADGTLYKQPDGSLYLQPEE